VVNVDGTPENVLPEACYKPDEVEVLTDDTKENEGLFDKVKKLF
jgi:hypothetical protein